MKILNKNYSANISTENAAFEDNGLDAELATIDASILSRISRGETSGKCLDSNGNTVGTWKARRPSARA